MYRVNPNPNLTLTLTPWPSSERPRPYHSGGVFTALQADAPPRVQSTFKCCPAATK